MIKNLKWLIAAMLMVLCSNGITAQPKNILPPAPVLPVPSPQQLKWHEMEMNAFIHFTTNTFTGKEWGYGDESPQIFNPSALDAEQWAKVLKETGFKTIILTTKHHDGFSLWPSKFTEHSVKNSPYKNGKGDVVKETSEAARKYGLQFGVYLSPWDRNHADYGKPAYITYYRNQLKELFTNYGPVFEMWFDGANGGDGFYGGANEKRNIDRVNYYNWPATLQFVRTLQPKVLFFSDGGPDLRWVGNERGVAGKTNWNTISTDTLHAGKSNIESLLNTGSADGKQWVPAEVDVSIRPGWFYHDKEDDKVKSPEKLLDIYLTSVGRGSTLLLNIPPDRRGLFHENDIKALYGFKALLDKEFAVNYAANAKATASNTRGKHIKYKATNVTNGKKESFWATDDAVKTATITIDLNKVVPLKYIVLQEYIKLGQRVQSFNVEVWTENKWQKVADETTIGYKRIIKMDPVKTNKFRVNITASKASPVISNIAAY